MIHDRTHRPRRSHADPTPRLFLLVAMAATVGTALGFQYIGGYIPCKLCLEERIPYYVGVPLMALAAISSWPALAADRHARLCWPSAGC